MTGRVGKLIASHLPRGTVVLAVLTFLAYATGLVRDRVFARTYGAGPELDAYNAAFQLPELLLAVLVMSALAGPFVPVYTTLRRDRPDAAPRFAQTVLTLAVLVMAATGLVLLTVAPVTADLVAPGFEPEGRQRYVDLFRLMLVTLVVFAASNTLGMVLVAERQFAYYALAPVLYNAGIVAGTVLLDDRLGIQAAAIGAVMGALLHLGIRVVGMRRTTVRLRPALDLRTPALRELAVLTLPNMLSHPIEYVTVVFLTRVATTLAAGSVSAVSFATNFQAAPVALVGVAISLAAFPALSASWAAGDRAGFGRQLRTYALSVTVLTVVAAASLVAFGPLGIELLLGGGEFDDADVALTAGVLAAFALSVPFDALGHLFTRGLYATHTTLLPVLASLAGLVVNVVVTLGLVEPVGVLSIPLGFAAGNAVRSGLEWAMLVHRTRAEPGTAPAAPGAQLGPSD